MSLFIRAPDFSPLKPLRSVSRFFCSGRARIIHDTNRKHVEEIQAFGQQALSPENLQLFEARYQKLI